MSAEDVSRMLEKLIPEKLAEWDGRRARSRTKAARTMGMSDLGGCREFIRATIAGDPGEEEAGLKWAAFIGTAIGDLTERALGETIGAKTQQWVTVTLDSGLTVSGSSDATVFDNHLVDFKTKLYLDDVVRSGPTLKQWIQVSGYLVGLVQAGQLTTEATASLVFMDRANNPNVVAFTCSYDEAVGYLERADERLEDVARALEGQDVGDLRDEPESWCWYTKCPFRESCWADSTEPLSELPVAGEHADAMRLYDRGRELAKTAKAMQQEAKDTLGGFGDDPVTGENAEYTLRWKESSGRYGGWTIDLRAKR